MFMNNHIWYVIHQDNMSSGFPSPFNPFDPTLIHQTGCDESPFRKAMDRHAAEKITDAAKEGMEQVRPKIKEAGTSSWWDQTSGQHQLSLIGFLFILFLTGFVDFFTSHVVQNLF